MTSSAEHGTTHLRGEERIVQKFTSDFKTFFVVDVVPSSKKTETVNGDRAVQRL